VLIIDNFAHSSRTAAIICFAFVTTLQDRPPALMSIHNVVSSVFRTARSAPCLLHSLQYPVHNPAVVIPLTHNSIFVSRASKAPALGLVSLSSRISARAPRVYSFATWCIKEVVSVVRCRQHPTLQRSSFCERDRDTPHSYSAVVNVGISSWSPPTSVESHRGDTTGAEETARERCTVSSRTQHAC